MSQKGEKFFLKNNVRRVVKYNKRRNFGFNEEYGYINKKRYSQSKHKVKNINCMYLQKKDIHKSEKFSSIIYDWLNSIKLNVKESTFAHYHTVIKNHLIPSLGNCFIADISDKYIDTYINSLINSGLSNKTINDILTLFKSVIKYAKSKNITLTCRLNNISVKNTKSITQTLNIDEQKRLTSFLINNINNKNLGILLSLYTGIRIGELCALRCSDVNIEEKTILINKTMLRIKNDFNQTNDTSQKKTKVIISSPKTIYSIRSIPIPDFLFNIIKKMYDGSGSFILTNKTDKYVEPRTMQYYFKKILKECSINNLKFHSLRHTFATRCIECGFDIKTLSEILGHANTRITLDRYVHCSMDLKRKNMDKLTLISA